jgi:hypothetical protein
MLSKEENGNDLNQIKKMIESFILQTKNTKIIDQISQQTYRPVFKILININYGF